MCKMKYNRLLWKDHSRRYSTTYKAEIILFISSSIQSSISVWFLKKDFVILLQESSALEEQMKNIAEVADLMSYSSSSIPMMFFFPSLIGSLFLLAHRFSFSSCHKKSASCDINSILSQFADFLQTFFRGSFYLQVWFYYLYSTRFLGVCRLLFQYNTSLLYQRRTFKGDFITTDSYINIADSVIWQRQEYQLSLYLT